MRAIYKRFCIFNILIFIINTALYIALAMGINRLYGTPGRYLSDYVVFYIAAVLAVYAFHGYDFHRPREINRIIVSTAAGVIMAALVTIPFMIIFRPHMNKTAFTLLVAGTFFIASASRAAGAFCFRKWVPGRDVVVVDDHACHITHVGRVLRKTRLDKIPQLWDVLRGKMSLIGLRPEQPEFEKQFAEEISFYRYRRLEKPGITGWAQTKYPYAASVEETKKKLEYDLYYVKNRSLTLYLQVILWTAETMLTMRGVRQEALSAF